MTSSLYHKSNRLSRGKWKIFWSDVDFSMMWDWKSIIQSEQMSVQATSDSAASTIKTINDRKADQLEQADPFLVCHGYCILSRHYRKLFGWNGAKRNEIRITFSLWMRLSFDSTNAQAHDTASPDVCCKPFSRSVPYNSQILILRLRWWSLRIHVRSSSVCALGCWPLGHSTRKRLTFSN